MTIVALFAVAIALLTVAVTGKLDGFVLACNY